MKLSEHACCQPKLDICGNECLVIKKKKKNWRQEMKINVRQAIPSYWLRAANDCRLTFSVVAHQRSFHFCACPVNVYTMTSNDPDSLKVGLFSWHTHIFIGECIHIHLITQFISRCTDSRHNLTQSRTLSCDSNLCIFPGFHIILLYWIYRVG